MNRQIKFRIWDYRFKRFDRTTPTGGLDSADIKISLDGELTWETEYGSGTINGAIQQFTGLKDKNGKEIFEGDIIKERHYDDFHDEEGFDYVGVVRYKTYNTCDMGTKFSGYVTFPNDRENKEYAGNSILEVIGNIFENPELLA